MNNDNTTKEIQPAPQPEHKLTGKQTRFVEEYLIDFNATQAYKRAGYAASTDSVAGVEGHKLLKKPKITAAIETKSKEFSSKLDITREMVLEGLFKETKTFEGQGCTQAARVQAWTQIGRAIAMFTDNQRLDLTDLTTRMRAAEARIEVRTGNKEIASQHKDDMPLNDKSIHINTETTDNEGNDENPCS